MEIIRFHNNTSKHKQKKKFQYLKNIFKNDDISFFEYLKFKNLNENTYIISLKSKLTKPYMFFKQILKNIKINAFNMRVAHLWFANTNIQFILDPYAIATHCT
jgi:hypothetical protein